MKSLIRAIAEGAGILLVLLLAGLTFLIVVAAIIEIVGVTTAYFVVTAITLVGLIWLAVQVIRDRAANLEKRKRTK